MRFAEHLQASPELLEWFSRNEFSLALSLRTEQALVFLSPDGEGQVRAVERRIQHPRSLHADRSRVIVATGHQIHELVNVLPDAATYDGYDHIYMLRRTHTTGAIGVRDLAGNAPGAPYFVSSRYNAVATLSDTYNFEIRWRPSSSRQLGSEVPFRLMGVARDARGEVCYATGIYEEESGEGASAGGAVVNVDTDSIVVDGAFAPVCPQFYDGDLYVADARNGALLRMGEDEKLETVVRLPAVPSSLFLHEGRVLATIPGSSGEGGPQSSPATATSPASRSELLVVDLATRSLIGKAQWPNEVGPPTDVQVLPEAKRPTALGPATAGLPRTIVFEADDGIVCHQIPAERSDPRSSESSSAPQTIPDDLTAPEKTEQAVRIGEGQDYSFFQGQLEAREFLSRFQSLLPGRFRRRIRTGAVDPSTPLFGVAAALGDQPVGVAAASAPDSSGVSQAHALKVSPPHRGQGVGTDLLGRLERRVRKVGAHVLQGSFRSSISSLPALERVLEKRNWEPPKVKRYLYKGERARVPESFIERLSQEPARGALFEWADLTADERADIEGRLNSTGESAIPASLSPFQLGVEADLDCSVGLRYDGRVAGWMITHRVMENLLQYTTLYVEPEVRGPGVGPTLLAEAIRRHAKRTDIPKFMWMVDAGKSRMRQFIDLRLAEVVDVQDKLLIAATRLGENSVGNAGE